MLEYKVEMYRLFIWASFFFGVLSVFSFVVMATEKFAYTSEVFTFNSTSRGVENLVGYWLGDEGFGPVLNQLQSGAI